jgi:tetratricopeptide (TPR) repeat protein
MLKLPHIQHMAVPDMIKTKIFIASSAETLRPDLTEIEAFILRLNKCYVSRELFFDPSLSSDFSDADARSKEIADSSIALFLIDAADTTGDRGRSPLRGTDTGDSIQATYKAARDSYNKTGKPRIVLYVKAADAASSGKLKVESGKLGDAPNAPSSNNFQLSTFNSQLYQSAYTHPDTLKLGILMQIKQLGLPGVDIRLEDGKAWQGDDALLSLENVESVTGYENLQNLKQRRAELESRYIEAKSRYAENPDDAAAYDAFFEVSKQRGNAMQEIQDIESQLYNLIEGMYVQTARGKLSSRQVEGYRLIERGKFQEAKTVLDFDEIVSDGRKKDEIAKQAAQDAQIIVNELLQLKDVNATLLDWDAVEACYKEAARLEEKHGLARDATFHYAEHLYHHSRHGEAIELGEKLLRYHRDPETEVPDDEKSFLLNMLGVFYMDSNRMAESEEVLDEALEIRRARTDGEQNVIEAEIAGAYFSLGNLYFYTDRFDKAIEAHRSAMDIRM